MVVVIVAIITCIVFVMMLTTQYLKTWYVDS